MSSRVVLTDVLCSSTAAISVTRRFNEVSSVHSILVTVSTVSNMKAVETAIIYLTHRLAAFVWIGLMFVFFRGLLADESREPNHEITRTRNHEKTQRFS